MKKLFFFWGGHRGIITFLRKSLFQETIFPKLLFKNKIKIRENCLFNRGFSCVKFFKL